MSDTYLDNDLSKKKSARYPEWLFERVRSFAEDYNERLDGIDRDTDDLELDTDSDALRRLIDLGLLAWYDPDYAVNFTAPPSENGYHCPGCGQGDINLLRAQLDIESNFNHPSRMLCLDCDHEAAPDLFEDKPLVDF